jgi:hypothetical protein
MYTIIGKSSFVFLGKGPMDPLTVEPLEDLDIGHYGMFDSRKAIPLTVEPSVDLLAGLDEPTRELLTGGVMTDVSSNEGYLSSGIPLTKEHLEHPVPHYLLERREEECTVKNKRKRNQKSMQADSGFIKKGRIEYRTQRTEKGAKKSLVTQKKEQRTCVQDALYHNLVALGLAVTIDEVRNIHPTDQNCPYSVAKTYVKNKFNLKLERVTSTFMVKGGEAFALLQQRTGYLVQIRVFDREDPAAAPDNHCIFYSGSEILDNQMSSKVIVIQESDRQDINSARAVFHAIDNRRNVRIANIYQLSARQSCVVKK